jgi:hypothetical protein
MIENENARERASDSSRGFNEARFHSFSEHEKFSSLLLVFNAARENKLRPCLCSSTFMHILVSHLIALTSEETREPFPFLLASKQPSIVVSCLDSFPHEADVYLFPFFRLKHFLFFRWKIS